MTLVVMAAVHYAIAAGDEGRAAAARALHADVAAREAELRALRSQVNPHFLFNCLHSVSALILNHPEGARRMCLELADFFRDSLRAGSLPRIPMEFEAALVRRYLDIERVRFGDRLRATISMAPDVERALVPPCCCSRLPKTPCGTAYVQMLKLDGFEVLDLAGRDTAVIFATAYDEYALKAFDVQANVEAHLDPRRFVRIHRSFLLNLDRLARLETTGKDTRKAVPPRGRRHLADIATPAGAGAARRSPICCRHIA